jgi:PAS domain S-box-containing protein
VIGAASVLDGNRRVEQLYEISKLFAAFDVVEHTLDAALKVIADKLPLESAILIEAVVGGHTDMIVWPSAGSDPRRLQLAKLHASSAYAYLVGASSYDALDLQEELREDLGPTALPVPDRSSGAPDDARRFIVIPLVVGRGAVFGALQLEGASRLDSYDLEFVNAVANQLAIALDRDHVRASDIQRRKEAQRSHAKYEMLVDNLDHAFVWEADAETHKISYISAQVEWMLGFTRQQCTDERDWWSAHAEPADRAQLEQTFERALAEAGHQRCEHRCVADDGRICWLRTSIHLVSNGDEPPHFQGVSFDITAARVAQQHTREQLAFTTAMASSLAEGTIAIDLDDRITFLNDAAAGMLGCAGRDMLGTLSVALLHVETAEGVAIESPLIAALRTARVRSDVRVIARTDGLRFSASYTATPIRRDGLVTGAVLAFDDISERKQSQEAAVFLHQARESLNASLESLAVARAAARLSVPVLCDLCFVDLASPDGRPAQVAWAHRDPAVQQEVDPMLAGDPRPPMFAKLFAEVVASARPVRLSVMTNDAVSAADAPIARRLAIRTALCVPLTLAGRQLGALTFCLTGTRQPREGDLVLMAEIARCTALAIDRARLYEHARQATALREQTLAIVSHDLRTPLATITMAASILADEDIMRVNPRSRMLAAEKIQTAAGHMDRMINDLLDFASIEAGRLSMTAKPHEVAEIIAETLSSFEGMAQKQRVALTRDVAPDLPAIQCDRDRILQVIANLVGNALKSTASGGSVCLGAKLAKREIVFSVVDTGPGISLVDQKRLFERYWRSPDASYKGTGLGLAIATGLIEAHGGRLWVDSVPGHGATFFFTVPLAAPRTPPWG